MEPGNRVNFHRGLEAKFHRVVEVLCSTEAVGDNIGISIHGKDDLMAKLPLGWETPVAEVARLAHQDIER